MVIQDHVAAIQLSQTFSCFDCFLRKLPRKWRKSYSLLRWWVVVGGIGTFNRDDQAWNRSLLGTRGAAQVSKKWPLGRPQRLLKNSRKIDDSDKRLNSELSTSDSFALESSKQASQGGGGTGRSSGLRRWGLGRRGRGEAELDVFTTWISAGVRPEEGNGRLPDSDAGKSHLVRWARQG